MLKLSIALIDRRDKIWGVIEYTEHSWQSIILQEVKI